MRRVPVTEDIAGLYVARTVAGRNGATPLLRAGSLIQQSTVAALLARGIESIWITDEIMPDLETPEVVQIETRQQVKAHLEVLYGDIAEGKRVNGNRAAQLVKAVGKLVDEIVADRDVASNVGHLRSWDSYTFEHSIQVAILAVIIGRRMRLGEDELVRLGTGAILHDIGKVAVPREILQKPGRLTLEEFDVIKTHPRVGWEMLHDGATSIMPTSSIVVLQHHERLDGSGYPGGLKGEEIYLFSRIAAVADVFDAVRAHRDYRPSHPPGEVLRILRQDAGPRLDRDAVEILLSQVAVVPVGEIVRLSDGTLGAVTAVDLRHPLQPTVTVVGDAEDHPVERRSVDLRGTDIEVTAILDDWPKEFSQRERSRSQSPDDHSTRRLRD